MGRVSENLVFIGPREQTHAMNNEMELLRCLPLALPQL